MRKRFILILSLLLMLVLAACGESRLENDSAKGSAASPTPILPENCAHGDWSEDHICRICGYVCEHETWEDGICTLCGKACEHPEHEAETQRCLICGEKVCHNFTHGLCACGAEPDIRTDYLDPYGVYFEEQEQQGTVLYIPYQAKNYCYPDGPDVFEKQLLVYLPYAYDESRPYNVLLYIHGTGGTPEDFLTREVDYYGPRPKVQGVNLFDYIFENKVAEPMILVAISLKAVIEGDIRTETSTEQIGQELRNDILPCIVEHFSTYAEDGSAESIAAARDHFALCGISTGSIFAYDSGILQNYDLFGSYIFLSGDGCTPEAAEAISSGDWADLPINYLYSGAGTVDIRNLSALHTYQYMAYHADKVVDGENAMHVFVDGGHKWSVWFTSLYNAMQLIFPPDVL